MKKICVVIWLLVLDAYNALDTAQYPTGTGGNPHVMVSSVGSASMVSEVCVRENGNTAYGGFDSVKLTFDNGEATAEYGDTSGGTFKCYAAKTGECFTSFQIFYGSYMKGLSLTTSDGVTFSWHTTSGTSSTGDFGVNGCLYGITARTGDTVDSLKFHYQVYEYRLTMDGHWDHGDKDLYSQCLAQSETTGSQTNYGGNKNLAVRCCTSGDVGSSPGCVSGKTWNEAKTICENNAATLCTPQQVISKVGGGTGCGFDGYLMWTSGECDLNAGYTAVHAVDGGSVCLAAKETTTYWGGKVGIRCCNGGNVGYGGVTPAECYSAQNWFVAESICGVEGKQLCSKEQIVSGDSKSTGCSFDEAWIWTNTPCPRRCAEETWFADGSRHTGKRPDCPFTTSMSNYFWGPLRAAKQACAEEEDCNVVVRYTAGETGNMHNYFLDCAPEWIENRKLITWKTTDMWGIGASDSQSHLLHCVYTPTSSPTSAPTSFEKPLFTRPICFDEHPVTARTDNQTLPSSTASEVSVYFFSIEESANPLFQSPEDFIDIELYSFSNIYHASYLQIMIFDDRIILYRVDPFDLENKYELGRVAYTVSTELPIDFWFQFSNSPGDVNGYMDFGTGTENNEGNLLITFPYNDFVEDEPQTASLRLSYESFKFINVFYHRENSDIAAQDDISFKLYKFCKNEDELDAFIKQFGFFAPDSGTSGVVHLNLYVHNNVYLCVFQGVDANEKAICTNLHYKKYSRCYHDGYRHLTDIYDYVLEIVVESNDYLSFSKLIIDDYTVVLDKQILLSGFSVDSTNRAVIGVNDAVIDESYNNRAILGVVTSSGASGSSSTDVTFGVGLKEKEHSQILLEVFDESTKYFCDFIPSLISDTSSGGGISYNYMCVNNADLEIYEDEAYAGFSYISFSTISCISQADTDKMKVTVDSDNNVEIDRIYVSDVEYNTFCIDTYGAECTGHEVEEVTGNDECSLRTDCFDIGIPSASVPDIKPVLIFDNIFSTAVGEPLITEHYNTLYELRITTCNAPTTASMLSVVLKGILGSSQREVLPNLPQNERKLYYIGAIDVGTLFGIQFEAEPGSGPICMNYVQLLKIETNEIIFQSKIDDIGKGVLIQSACSISYHLLADNIFIPCVDRVFTLETYENRLYTKLSLELCSGSADVGLTAANQKNLKVVLTGVDSKGIYKTTEGISIDSNYDWGLPTNIREYNILYNNYDVSSISVVWLSNDQNIPICIDKVIVNQQKAILSDFWIGAADCANYKCQPAIPAVLSWPICNVEIIDARSVLKSKKDGEGDIFAGSCSNFARFSSVECSAEKAYAFETSSEWSNEVSRSKSEAFETASSTSEEWHWEVGVAVETEFSIPLVGGVKVTASASGGESTTHETTKTTSRGTELSKTTSTTWSKASSAEIHCASSVEVGPFQKVNYEIIKAVSITEYVTETDFKLTKCSYMLDQDDTNPAHFIYLMGIPGKITLQEAVSCNIQFYATEYIQTSYKCNEARKINAIEMNTYVPFCNPDDDETWDECQCETGDALTDQTCYCVDPATGMQTDISQATAIDNSVTSWKTWCAQKCPGTQFKADGEITDINGNPIVDIISAHVNNENLNSHENENDNGNDEKNTYKVIDMGRYHSIIIAIVLIAAGFLVVYVINSCIKCAGNFNSLEKKFQLIPQFDEDTEHQI